MSPRNYALTPSRQEYGVTLIELLVTVTVLGILLAVAVPSFHDAFLNGKLTSQANGFLSSLTVARSEAIKRNGRVVVCKSANGASCTTAGNWSQGWIVFHDINGDNVVDAGEAVIQRGDPLNTGFRMTGNVNFANRVVYRPNGTATQFDTLTLCRHAPSIGSSNREIIISATGRPRIQVNDNVTVCPS